MFPFEICEVFNNTYFEEHLLTTAPGHQQLVLKLVSTLEKSQGRVVGSFFMVGAEPKCRPPWLAGDEKLKKALTKTPQSSPLKNETWTKI